MEITKQFKFELAHRLVSSYSRKCQSIHGHSYIAELTLKGDALNKDGMLLDFGKLKDGIINLFDNWDHSFMFYSKDPLAKDYLRLLKKAPLRMIEVDYNPTAENMAYHIYNISTALGLPIERVRVQETKTGWAVADSLNSYIGNTVHYYNMEACYDNISNS